MIRSKQVSWLAAGLLALAGFANTVAAAESADEAAIRAQTTSWGKAYNGGDAKGVAALYADDALLMPPGSPGLNGKAAILAYFTKDIAGSKAAGAVFVLSPKTDVGVSGDMGWESGTYKVTIKGAVVESGKFLSVSKKKDGKWLYLRDTWNADGAPPAPPAPAVSAAPAKAPAAPAAPAAPVPPKK